ncbi:polysaccharide deacetylase family protein [bacterium]|nr:polysaccharide deacetylase family protein [bacterium]
MHPLERLIIKGSSIPVILFLLAAFSCNRDTATFNREEEVARIVKLPNLGTGRSYKPNPTLCVWRGNQKAACTIGFDDVLASHYQLAAPRLKARQMHGTFYLNTKNVYRWSFWNALAQDGHEIASHTWSHPKCTEISEESLRNELERARNDILRNIIGQTDVPSFAYPSGLYNDQVRKVVLEYHQSARGSFGINPPVLNNDDFSLIKGIGAYPPYDPHYLAELLTRTVHDGGWILCYFHSISTDGSMNQTTIPLDLFTRHLDAVDSLRDELWIATQKQVVEYIKLRQNARVTSSVIDSSVVEISLKNDYFGTLTENSVDVMMDLPEYWSGNIIVVTSEADNQSQILPFSDKIIVSIRNLETVSITCKKKI